jgi:hypothetical protein
MEAPNRVSQLGDIEQQRRQIEQLKQQQQLK